MASFKHTTGLFCAGLLLAVLAGLALAAISLFLVFLGVLAIGQALTGSVKDLARAAVRLTLRS
jgi:hypothetical protein